ncbi:hypothetical protein A2110_01535 [Candidatus Jorgensenbacteria bacterium GWA1_54_12]|uniref:Uncharacterized protein n=1 Tax=Candidatus Jorgensenbacteria bacterium GWA1_54_12 TaxID=1798468 RepID=A0A1F6BMF1_9BACT|nr:MAG: hypothetical protein A2110_01535 [Candidatus Jorgensenbacteria bacterium GWA1_54_12]
MLTFTEGTFGKDFGGLLKGSHVGRLMKGDDIMRRLLPETERERLRRKGLTCSTHHEPSKTNPRLVFLFTRNGSAAGCWVTCDVGKHTLQTERGEEELYSLRQVFRRVREAVKALDA